jgi:hypothetical protein
MACSPDAWADADRAAAVMSLLVVRVLVVPALAVARLAPRRGAGEARDEFLRAGDDDHLSTVAQAALRGGGTSAWMRPGGG